MKKIILFGLIACSFSSNLKAQTDQKFKFSVGPELSIPTGTFSNGWSFGIGGTAQVEVPVQQNFNVTGTAGVILYNGKTVGNGLKNTSLTIIPIRVGGKYFFTSGIYGAAQLGIGIINRGNGTAFAYSPQLGYEFKTNSDKAIDLSLKYDGYSGKNALKEGYTFSALGIRVAYIF